MTWTWFTVPWGLAGAVTFLRLRRRVLHTLGYPRRGSPPHLAIGPPYLRGNLLLASVVFAWPLALALWSWLSGCLVRKPSLMFSEGSLEKRGLPS